MEHEVIPAGERHAPHQWEVANQTARLALTTLTGDVGKTCWQKSDNTQWVCTAANTWAQLSASSGAVASVAGKTGVVTLVADDVGLGSVNNTSDANKPISTAQQAALNLKAPLASPAFTGTPTGITKAHVGLGSVDNTADSAKPVSTAQQGALDLKAPLASPAFTGTPTGITKTHVGLSNVDNTADSAKPISTAQQAALDLKAPLGPTVQTARTGASTMVLGDNNTIIPFSAAATFTVPSGLAANPLFQVEGVRTGAGAVVLTRGAGTVLIFEGADVESVTLGADGSRFVLMGHSVANKYYAYRIGA